MQQGLRAWRADRADDDDFDMLHVFASRKIKKKKKIIISLIDSPGRTGQSPAVHTYDLKYDIINFWNMDM